MELREKVARAICCEGHACAAECDGNKCGALEHWSDEAQAAIDTVFAHLQDQIKADPEYGGEDFGPGFDAVLAILDAAQKGE